MSDMSMSSMSGNGAFESGLPASLVEAQERQTAMLTRANEIMASAAKAIWESQAELLQSETDSGLKTLTMKPGDPVETVATMCKNWRENSEKVISHMRTINDVARQYGWQLMDLYADSMRPGARR